MVTTKLFPEADVGPKSAEPAKYTGCVAGIPEKNPGIHVHAHAPGKCPPGLASSLDFASDFAPDQLSDLGDLEHLVLETQGGGGKLERNRMEHQTPSVFPGNFRKRKVLGTLCFPFCFPENLVQPKLNPEARRRLHLTRPTF